MILIDSRQGSIELEPYISAPHAVCRLEFADFAFSGNGPEGGVSVGIERKSLLDMLSSMTTGRLSGHQLIGLYKHYDFVYILVEGVWRPDPKQGILLHMEGKHWKPVKLGKRRFMAREVYNFLNTLSVISGSNVMRTCSYVETGKWLDSTYSWWQKPWHAHKSHLQWHRPAATVSLTKPTLAEKLWSQFEGVGGDKARELAKRFPMAEDIIFCSEAELIEVPTIGKKIAKSIIRQRNNEGGTV
jgi:ERCC4-type nuclease